MKRNILHIAGWLFAAAASGYAATLTAVHPTPVDRALPFLAVVLTVVAWLGRSPLAQSFVALLLVTEIAFPDEMMRLIALGIVIAAAFAAAAPHVEQRAPLLAVCALLVLRWIPFEEVRLKRELLLLVLVAAIVWLLRNTPFAIVFGVVVGLVTSTIPLRTLALAIAIAGALAIVRFFIGLPEIRLTVPSLALLACVLTFFAWSGVVARAWPYLLSDAFPKKRTTPVGAALQASESELLEVPHDAVALIVSGANVAGLGRGTPLARIEPGPVEIRIGDASDWGYTRREFFYGARNPLPRDPAGQLRGYGYGAWVDGAGRIALPADARTIRITAAPTLPRGAVLQVEGFELR